MVLRQARRTAESCLNRPGVVELRRADERFYVARRVVGDGVGIWSHKEKWVMITLPFLKGIMIIMSIVFFEFLPLRFTVFICFLFLCSVVSLLLCFWVVAGVYKWLKGMDPTRLRTTLNVNWLICWG